MKLILPILNLQRPMLPRFGNAIYAQMEDSEFDIRIFDSPYGFRVTQISGDPHIAVRTKISAYLSKRDSEIERLNSSTK